MVELHQYLVMLILNSLVCFGVYASCNYEIDINRNKPTKDMIFWWIKFYGNKYCPTIIKPICGCMTCMASLHWIYFFIPIHGVQWTYEIFGIFIAYVFALAGLNTILGQLFK